MLIMIKGLMHYIVIAEFSGTESDVAALDVTMSTLFAVALVYV